MTYADRKEQQRCTHYRCPSEPLEDNLMCEVHRDDHRARNRRWKRLLAFRWEQIEIFNAV